MTPSSESSSAIGDTPAVEVVAVKDVDVVATTKDANVSKQPAAEATAQELGYYPLPKRRFAALFAAMCVSAFMAGLDITIIVTAMPVIAREFEALSTISWVVTAFMLTQTSITPLVGRFADIFGRRSVIIFTISSFIIGSIGCALSNNIISLIVLRAVQGIGGGGMFACNMIILADITPATTRAAWIGPIAGMFALSSVVGPLLGGFLTDGPGWRWCFWINVPIGVPCLAAFWFFIPAALGRQHLLTAATPAAAAASAPSSAVTSIEEGTSTPTPIGAESQDPSAETPLPDGTATPSAVPLVKHDADDSGLHHRGTAASTEKPALEVVAQTEGASAPTVTATPAAAAPQFKRARIDWLGIITLTVAVICLCLAVVWGGAEYGWSDGRIIALLTIAGVFLCVFITIEAVQAEDPIMPMRLFLIRNYATSAWLSFMSGFTMLVQYVYLPVFFQYVYEQTATQSGVSVIPMMLALPVGAITSGIIITKTGKYIHLPIIGAALTVIACWLYTTLDVDSPFHQRIGYLILGGFSMGPLVQVPLLQAQNAVPPEDMAVTSSSMQFFQSIGGLLSTAIAQSVMNNRITEDFPKVMNGSLNILEMFRVAVGSTFYCGLAGAAAALVGALFSRHIPLKGGSGGAPVAH